MDQGDLFDPIFVIEKEDLRKGMIIDFDTYEFWNIKSW